MYLVPIAQCMIYWPNTFDVLTLWTRMAYIYAVAVLPMSVNGVYIRLRYVRALTTQSQEA